MTLSFAGRNVLPCYSASFAWAPAGRIGTAAEVGQESVSRERERFCPTSPPRGWVRSFDRVDFSAAGSACAAGGERARFPTDATAARGTVYHLDAGRSVRSGRAGRVLRPTCSHCVLRVGSFRRAGCADRGLCPVLRVRRVAYRALRSGDRAGAAVRVRNGCRPHQHRPCVTRLEWHPRNRPSAASARPAQRAGPTLAPADLDRTRPDRGPRVSRAPAYLC